MKMWEKNTINLKYSPEKDRKQVHLNIPNVESAWNETLSFWT